MRRRYRPNAAGVPVAGLGYGALLGALELLLHLDLSEAALPSLLFATSSSLPSAGFVVDWPSVPDGCSTALALVLGLIGLASCGQVCDRGRPASRIAVAKPANSS
jgi:hypothetical protein